MVLFNYLKRGIGWFGLSSQVFLIVASFILTLQLGGLLRSGGIILLGLIGPVYALAFPDKKRALWLLGGYLCLVFATMLLDSRISPEIQLTHRQNLYLFTWNFFNNIIFWFAALYYFAVGRTQALKLLRIEEGKKHALLRNILPEKIIEVLKDDQKIIAEQLDETTILFADLVEFTPMAHHMPPRDIVRFLNRIFSVFDDFSDKYQLEKIKTIGDCYMAAAGVPRPQEGHAVSAVKMALDIRGYAREQNLLFRIGIHSGAVIAGVIGVKKFSYDLWGEVVNMASRLETSAPSGGILISQETYELIAGRFRCEFGGVKNLKGIGTINTWIVMEEIVA